MSGMHLLPVYYTTTSNRKRKKQKKSKSILAAEKEHAKFLKRMGVGSRSSVGLEQRSSKPWVTGSSPVESANQRSVAQPGSASALGAEGQRFKSSHSDHSFQPCVKKDESYKLDVSDRYVVGQAYNKGGLQVLSKREQNDPATGKRR
jgi:hypothetical protein